ncbi:MAG: hypothetical protein IJQ60_15490 [Prevotella sp.]|nr:hypothetical protein [Prevotella sp.]
MKKKKSTRELFLDTLAKLGCPYELSNEDNDLLYFRYQGECFMVRSNDEEPYIVIYDYEWEGVALDDIDEVVRLRKAINEANWKGCVSTFFSIDEETKTMDVHSKSVAYFTTDIPNPERYLCLELNEFFNAHQYFRAEMAKLRAIEGAESK